MKKIFSKLTMVFFAVMMLFIIGTKADAAAPKLEVTKATGYVGHYTNIRVKNNYGYPFQSVKWSVSNKSKLKLVKKSNWEATVLCKKAGTNYLYATIGGKKYKCKITVKKTAPTAELVLADGTVKLPGDTITLEELKGASFKLGKFSEKVWFAGLASDGEYNFMKENEADWAYEKKYASGSTISLGKYAGYFTGSTYDDFCVELKTVKSGTLFEYNYKIIE